VEALAKALAQALAPTKPVKASHRGLGAHQTLETLSGPRPLGNLMKDGAFAKVLAQALAPTKPVNAS
jgi:hypothetical protein